MHEIAEIQSVSSLSEFDKCSFFDIILFPAYFSRILIMKRFFFLPVFVFLCIVSHAQVQEKLAAAMRGYLKDEQFAHALNGFFVIETKTGKPVYDLNGQTGFAPASSQKILTAIAGFELLGEDSKYVTSIYLQNGNLIIKGSADPTFGSWRYPSSKRERILQSIVDALKKNGISEITGDLVLDNSLCSYQPIPGGWIWDDIGNYYGAGSWAINWNENQYDLLLQPGTKENEPVKIIGTSPPTGLTYENFLLTGKPGTGDNGYIYLPPYSKNAFVTGTEGATQKTISISGSLPDPAIQLADELRNSLSKDKITLKGSVNVTYEPVTVSSGNLLVSFPSPSYDSICYWFLQKSINLYGEAIAKTIAINQSKAGNTENGIEAIIQFWKKNGIDPAAINIVDGSGLSPQNRVTPAALVDALQFAKRKDWFQKFLRAMPTYNDIKMKSGTIGGAKAFAGYVTSKSGTEYTFAIISNNFSGSAGAVVQKMYKVLNVLKE